MIEPVQRPSLARLTALGASPTRAEVLLDRSRAEIGYLLETGMAGRLIDLTFRRADIAISGRLMAAVARERAGLALEALGWSERRCAEPPDGMIAGCDPKLETAVRMEVFQP